MATLLASGPVAQNASSFLAGTRLTAPRLARRVALARRSPLSRNLGRLTAVRAEAVEFATEAPAAELIPDVTSTPAAEAPASFLASFVDSTKAALSDAAESISDAADSAMESVQDIAGSAIESVQDIAETVVESVQDAADTVKESSQGLLEKATSPAVAEVTDDVAPQALFQAGDDESAGGVGADVSASAGLPDVSGGFEVPPEPTLPELPTESFASPAEGVSDFKAQGFELPDFGAPNFKVPELKAPDFKVPEFKVPELQTPDFKFPDFSLPKADFSLPKPDFTLPKFEKPEFKLPDFSSPDFNLQDAIKSKLSEFTLPEVELPESIKSKLPVLPELPALPALPALPTPSLPAAGVPLPKLSLPPAVTEPVKSAVSDATAAAEAQAALASAFVLQKAALLYSQAREQVPTEYEPYVARVEANLESFSTAAAQFSKIASAKLAEVSGEAVKSAFEAAGYQVDESVIAFTLISLSTGLLVVTYYRAVYGGYSGDLTPEESLKMLKESRAILLDLRPESLQDEEGIPDLRRGARFKDRSLQFQKYTGQLRNQLRSADAVDLQLFAATVKGLKGVSTGTSVVVMDEGGSSQAKEIARGLAKYGFQRSYILEGGFKAWVDSGLRVKPNEPEPLADLLQNEFEAFVEEVKPTPEGVITVLAGTGVAVYALWEWERSLQILAIALAAQIIYTRAKTYEKPADLQRDVKIVTAPFWVVGTVLGWVVKLVSPAPAPPKLATAGADAEVESDDVTSAEKPEAQNGSVNVRVLPSAAAEATAPAPASATTATETETETETKKQPETETKGEEESAPSSPLPAPAAELEAPTGPVEPELPTAVPQEPELPPAPVETEPLVVSAQASSEVEAKAPELDQKPEPSAASGSNEQTAKSSSL